MAQTVRPAPSCDTSGKSDAMHYLANAGSISADLNLTTISGKYPFAPQKTTMWVDSTPAAIVLVDEDGTSFTITVGTGPVVISRPIKQLTDTGSGAVNVIFEWFDPMATCFRNP